MTELSRPSLTASSSKTSHKFKLNCQSKLTPDNPTTKDWLTDIKKELEVHDILQGFLDKRKEVVIKYGTPAEIQTDYTIAETLNGLPNFLKYYCNFTCENGEITTGWRSAHLCNPSASPKKRYGFIIMPYFPLGSMMNYRWDIRNFDIMKSTAKQVCFAMLHAFEKHGMVHNDLHLGNVMMRRTKKVSVKYGAYELPTNGIYPIIIDFDVSVNKYMRETKPEGVYNDIRQVISGLTSLTNSDLALDLNVQRFVSLSNANAPVTEAVYQTVLDCIDSIKIRYEKSKMPPPPLNWGKPVGGRKTRA